MEGHTTDDRQLAGAVSTQWNSQTGGGESPDGARRSFQCIHAGSYEVNDSRGGCCAK